MRRRSGVVSAFSSAFLATVKRPNIIIMGCVVGTLSPGCANTKALETEVSRLRRELHFVRQDLSEQKRAVEGLERRMTLVSLGQPPSTPSKSRPLVQIPGDGPPPDSVTMARPGPVASADRPAAPPPKARPPVSPARRKTLPVVRLGANAKPKPVRQEDWVDPGAQDDGGPPLKFTMGTDDEASGSDSRLSVDRSVLRRPDPVLDRADRSSQTVSRATPSAGRPAVAPRRSRASRAEVKAQYQSALARLRENKEPQAALGMFDAFLAAHPKSRFADNAAYWRGECLFALVKHEEAIVAFDALEKRHPKSPKVPFGLVRKGESLLALKRKPEAIAAFKKVTTQYATSEAAGMAKRFLSQAQGGR